MVIGFLVLTSIRVVYSSGVEYKRGAEALKTDNVKTALVHFRRSARWYAPGNPYVVSSYKALWEIGREAERKGDGDTALEAYRSIRGAILGCRSFYTPHAGWLDRVNLKIAQLMAAQQVQKGISNELVQHHPAFASRKTPGEKGDLDENRLPDSDQRVDPREAREKLKKWHLEQLEKTTAPSVGWSLVAILGLVVWIGGGFAFAYRAITPEDKLHAKRAVFYGAVIVLGLLFWMMGLHLA